jgi:glycosyltransferase involved in cell wall biosynthesis
MYSSVDIVIPVLNESQTLEIQIIKLQKFLENADSFTFSYGITIADNGSTDSTLEIARDLASRFHNIRVVTVGKRWVGLALKSAWDSSDCEYIGYMDLDFSTDLHHLIDVEVAFLHNYHCVFGSRRLPQSVVIGRTLKRSITSMVFNLLVRRTFHVPLTDGMCGFKFFKREIFSDVVRIGAECDGWFFCTEIVVAAQLGGFKVLEIPVTWTDDAESKVRIPSLTLEYIRDILKFRCKTPPDP